MKENKKIAVLIPCYNESKTVEKVINDYKKVLPEADIYVYDNNSTDGTVRILEEIMKSNFRVSLEEVHNDEFK
jgi:glycosyltransferase involved in cell wall biosynthesis